jgi:hypothetical protein
MCTTSMNTTAAVTAVMVTTRASATTLAADHAVSRGVSRGAGTEAVATVAGVARSAETCARRSCCCSARARCTATS